MDSTQQAAGWIKLWRCSKSSRFWDEMPYSTGKLWLWLLLEATHKGNAPSKSLLPGQCCHSIRFIRESMRWTDPIKRKTLAPSHRTIYASLEALKQDGQISIENSPRAVTVITICNWDIYQSNDPPTGNSNGNSNGNKLKNVKNEKKEEMPCRTIGNFSSWKEKRPIKKALSVPSLPAPGSKEYWDKIQEDNRRVLTADQ